ncbi:hypothetical protein [Allorhodopirellula heiligendammensis]|uniref:Uncharacterized protein n=1 Tax=Allorhodopirellula heiligendammensis TaxID=2714739 RepID=A0A5C6BXT1_9BACT|nr:hypothetical protein [Allorhodopirellula heiligendammensis]TWU16688.1 hypothetical protein Poly21_38930 [Allorhodopirellula heiligendammensis]
MAKENADQIEQSYFRHNFRCWLEKRPNGTLGQLRDWLERVHDQCWKFVDRDDPAIEQTKKIPSPLCEYLNYWSEHDGESFSYREANIEEDIMNVDGFIEDLGPKTMLASFPVFEVA